MARLIILRDGETHEATYGRIYAPGLELVSVERTWEDNRPFISCIPAGDYHLSPHGSPKFGLCYALHGNGISITQDGLSSRYAILIHPANLAHQLYGCIAPGMDYGRLTVRGTDGCGVVRSREAMARLTDAIERNNIREVTIQWK